MTELLTSQQMRALEQAAIASGDVTGLELMERAGRGVVEAIFEEWPALATAPHRAVVLCGPGNNGGDGFVVARLLKEWGWEVEAFLYGDPAKLPPDAKANYERWGEMGEMGEISDLVSNSDLAFTEMFRKEAAIVVDAIFGTGLSRPIENELAENIFFGCHPDGDLAIERPDTPKFVSVDVISGICSDSGKPLKAVLPSDLTVAFHRAKLGHYLASGGQFSEGLVVKDIGLPNSSVKHLGAVKLTNGIMSEPLNNHAYIGQGFDLAKGKETLQTWLGWPTGNHKYHHGHALVFSGPSFRTGAARLAARGALRIGAGVVTVCARPEAVPALAAHLTAIMIDEVQGAEDLAIKYGSDERITALCIGPALGVDARGQDLVAGALDFKQPTVLDADALSLLSQHPDMFGKLHEKCVLTPHAGEFKRMFPDIAAKLDAPALKGPAYSKVDATREAAKRAGCVVLFKGPDTVIAHPGGRCSINSAQYDRAAPWLATAGSGDVLAGFITGLLARGFAPMQAAETAAWLHVECARAFGPGLIAEDLPEMLPQVFRNLGM